jgi:photosystem II stability/assembly factor-like uncharacterized protein
MKLSKLTTNALTFILIFCFTEGSLISVGFAKDTINPSLFENKEWRLIGPFRGGRVVTVTGVKNDPMTYYMGAAGGGVWKTKNGGTTWENKSDKDFNVGTIGAVAVSESDPNVVYVGTGEAPIRGVTTSHGDGVYKSTDGGDNWKHIGLQNSGQISKIKIHPTNPDIAYVAVQGNIWGPTDERGIYRTIDGGKTWQQVLKVNDRTGGGDLSMDPTNPRILYAAMWQHGRTPWYVHSGGTDGGIFKSLDGGDTWEKSSGGLPELIGKVGVDVSASNPKRIYAVVEADMNTNDGGVYRSDDGGETWKNMSPGRLTHTRAWYYNHITADPVDEDTVYVMNVPLLKSIDGGKTFSIIDQPHGDNHDLWINPENNKIIASANDGGANVTYDGGKTWSSIMNQPTAQFYRVITDNMMPYRIYGGQQDNETVAITSESFTGGIGVDDYYAVGGGESAHIAFDENNPRLVYASTINGTLTEIDTVNRRTRPIKPYPEYVYGVQPKDLKYRTNWNAPVASSPHDPSIIYYGTEKILKSSDRGVTWTEISPDLTKNDKNKQGLNGGPLTNEQVGAEYYGTVFYIVESSHEQGVIWSGSDDGLVYLTRDNGNTWQNVTPKGAKEAQINAIEISPHDPATAYIAVTGYKLNDFSPYIYKTTNYGQSWKRIDKDLPQNTFVRVVREDHTKKGLLYAGTETGMFVSFDDGENWQSLKLNLPPVPITDLTIRQGDLVAATQGRGFYVLDDIAIFNQLSDELSKKPLHVFNPSPTLMIKGRGSNDEIEGANPPSGVILSYHINDEFDGPLSIDILDMAGKVVRHYSSEESDYERCITSNMAPRHYKEFKYPSKKKGMNIWNWDLQRNGIRCIENIRLFVDFDGAVVMPGNYQARITLGNAQEIVPLELLPDPRIDATPSDYVALNLKIVEGTIMMNEILGDLDTVRKARRQIKQLMSDYPNDEALILSGNVAISNIGVWENKVTQTKFQVVEDEDAWPSMLEVQVKHVIDVMDGAGAPVASGALQRLEDLKAEWAILKGELNTIKSNDIAEINTWAKQKDIKHVISP